MPPILTSFSSNTRSEDYTQQTCSTCGVCREKKGCNSSFRLSLRTDVTRLENYTLPALEPTVEQETDSSSSSSGLVCDSSTISNAQNLNRFIKNFEKLLRFLLLPDHHVNGIPPVGVRDRKHALQLCISACDVPIPIANEWFQPVFKCPRPPKRRKKPKIIGLN